MRPEFPFDILWINETRWNIDRGFFRLFIRACWHIIFSPKVFSWHALTVVQHDLGVCGAFLWRRDDQLQIITVRDNDWCMLLRKPSLMVVLYHPTKLKRVGDSEEGFSSQLNRHWDDTSMECRHCVKMLFLSVSMHFNINQCQNEIRSMRKVINEMRNQRSRTQHRTHQLRAHSQLHLRLTREWNPSGKDEKADEKYDGRDLTCLWARWEGISFDLCSHGRFQRARSQPITLRHRPVSAALGPC